MRYAGTVPRKGDNDTKEVVVSPELWSIITAAIAILIAIATSNRSLRREVSERIEAVNKRFDTVDKRFDAVDKRFDAVDKRFDTVDKRFEAISKRIDELSERLADLRERVGRIEGLLEGFRLIRPERTEKER